MSFLGPSLRHCARAAHLQSKKCHSGGERLATLCPIKIEFKKKLHKLVWQ